MYKRQVKVPYYNCVAVNIFLEVLQDFLYVFGCSYVGCVYIYNVYVFLVDSSFEYYEGTPFMALLLKSILSDMSVATLVFFLMYFGAPMLCACIFTIFMSSWWILPLSILK